MTAITRTSFVVASRDQVGSDLGGETVLLGLKSARYYGLQDVGARIWELLQTPIAVANICETICREYDVSPDQCEVDVIRFLDDLAGNELIEVRGGP
jgi:hypothetical protein